MMMMMKITRNVTKKEVVKDNNQVITFELHKDIARNEKEEHIEAIKQA